MRITQTLARPAAVPSIRVNRQNLDHHLWDNNGTWWCHFTLHLPDFTKVRVRRSLRTRDHLIARRRRDNILQSLGAAS